ncbi:MAG TPA: glycosyltransferase family 39 protein [Tepidisphaeraceae bacterium]|jgi:4-amino-4-deoxy-L-arabinose transferase-like glycosyltransferase|nr:glycosyltransferase family 39 protein [Tepidisphaeraceae bacterium]
MSSDAKRTVLILIAAAIVYLAGNARMGLWDRDEPRYAECSREMLQSGDWVVPRIYDKLRTQKPPLIYWCQASAMWLFGSQGNAGAFSARAPSVLAMLATLALLAVVIARHSGAEQAKWTVLVMASSVMTIMAAKICLTDSVLILFITVAQFCVYAIWRGNRSWKVAILLAVMLGLGGLTKGPFIIGIVACTAAALGVFRTIDSMIQRRQKTSAIPAAPALRPATSSEFSHGREPASAEKPTAVEYYRETGIPVHPTSSWLVSATQIAVGLLIIGGIVLPWILLVHHRAPDFLPRIFKEARDHTISGKEGHSFYPGYHLLVVWPMFMPWSLLLPLTIGVAVANRKIAEIRFALAAVLGPWVMVELIGTKLPHYFLAAYPALAFLTAFTIRRCLHTNADDLRSRPFFVAAGLWALAAASIGTLPWIAAFYFRPLPWGTMVLLSLISAAYAISVLTLMTRRKYAATFWTMGIGMLVAAAVLCLLYFPNADFLRLSIRVADALKRQGATHPGDVRMIDYKEPSLGFYQGGSIREESDSKRFLANPLSQWPRWTVMTREVWNVTPAADKPYLRVVDSFRGWALSARIEEVMVVEKRAMKDENRIEQSEINNPKHIARLK